MDGRRFLGDFFRPDSERQKSQAVALPQHSTKKLTIFNYVSYYLINNVLTEEDNNNNSNWPLPRITQSIIHFIREK